MKSKIWRMISGERWFESRDVANPDGIVDSFNGLYDQFVHITNNAERNRFVCAGGFHYD